MSRTKSWVVALGVDGEVLGAEHGAPPEWVGARLDEPASLQAAARAVIAAAADGATLTRAQVDVPELDATVELVCVPAIGLHRTPTDVRALLHDAMATLKRQAQALDVALHVTVDPGVPPSILLDPEKIAWAVATLVGNSMRYVRRGTRHQPGGSIAVKAGGGAATGEIVLVVVDDGPGIAASVVERLFRRAPGAPLAAGLALGVVRDVVTAHGGTLDIATSTDAVDHGTTVTVRLPLR